MYCDAAPLFVIEYFYMVILMHWLVSKWSGYLPYCWLYLSKHFCWHIFRYNICIIHKDNSTTQWCVMVTTGETRVAQFVPCCCSSRAPRLVEVAPPQSLRLCTQSWTHAAATFSRIPGLLNIGKWLSTFPELRALPRCWRMAPRWG